MSSYYSIFGLTVMSSDPLPGAIVMMPDEKPDLTIRRVDALELSDHGRVARLDREESPLRFGRAARGYEFAYDDGCRFRLSLDGRTVEAVAPASFDDAAIYLLGPVLGFSLRLRGIVPLHAASFTIEGRGYAVASEAGGGKSTLSAALHRRGIDVLSDDVTPIFGDAGDWSIRRGTARIRLWEDSAEAITGGDLPKILSSWEKRALDFAPSSDRRSEWPLGGILLMSPGETFEIRALSQREALVGLVTQSYVNYLLDDELRRVEFDVLSGVVKGVPVHSMTRTSSLQQIDQLVSAVLALADKVSSDR